MSNCSKHKKEVCGVSDMKVLAEMITSMHYQSLAELYRHMGGSLKFDAFKDRHNTAKPKPRLADALWIAGDHLEVAAEVIEKAWQISKPFMKQ